MIKKKKEIWEAPWGYLESFFITIGLATTALGLDIIIPSPVPLFEYPINLVTLFGLILLLILGYSFFKKTTIIRWLGSTPAAISTIILFSIVSLLIALIPQKSGKYISFFQSITSTKLYFISVFYFIVVLGFATIKRIIPFKKKNLAFIFNHLGLWIVIVTTHIGAGSIEKYTMYLHKNKKVNQVFTHNGKTGKLPFYIKLNDFSIEEYAPKIAFINAKTGNYLKNKGKSAIFEISNNLEINIFDFKIKLLEYFPLAARFSSKKYKKVSHPEAAPAVLIEIRDKENKKLKQKWISCGSIMTPIESLLLTKEKAIVMTKPEVKTYISDVSIFRNKSLVEEAKILVNKPLSFGKWKIYQTGFDEKKGKFSEVSIVELVSDSWLPFVYFGAFLMLIGAFFMIRL